MYFHHFCFRQGRLKGLDKDTFLLPGEVLEDLQLAGMKILQKTTGFRFSMDAVLLADFARMGSHDRVVDFGTGTGILPLLLLGRGKGLSYDAFEIQPDMADMCRRTMACNHVSDRIHVHCMDVREAHTVLGYEKTDHIICNPPFGQPGCSLVNPSPEKAVARHLGEDGLLPWLQEGFRLLRGHGRFSMIYPAERMLQAMEQMDSVHLTPKRFRLIYPGPDRAANLVLIEAQKNAKPLLHTEPPLMVRDGDGNESEEIRSIYHLA